MRALLIRQGSKMRLAHRLLVSQQRMMSDVDTYNLDVSELTVRERTALFKQDMDSLPVPYGDWQTEYSKVQTRYHIHMVISTVLFAAAMYILCTQGYIVKPDLKKPLNLEEVHQARLEKSREE